MLIPESVVFAFEIWIGFAWFVAFLLLSVIPITFQQERQWSEGVARLHYISLCIGVIIGFAANFLQAREDKSIMKPNGRRILPEISLYGAMGVPGFLPLRRFKYSLIQYGYLPWIAPKIALLPIAIGIFFIFELIHKSRSRLDAKYAQWCCYALRAPVLLERGISVCKSALGDSWYPIDVHSFHDVRVGLFCGYDRRW